MTCTLLLPLCKSFTHTHIHTVPKVVRIHQDSLPRTPSNIVDREQVKEMVFNISMDMDCEILPSDLPFGVQQLFQGEVKLLKDMCVVLGITGHSGVFDHDADHCTIEREIVLDLQDLVARLKGWIDDDQVDGMMLDGTMSNVRQRVQKNTIHSCTLLPQQWSTSQCSQTEKPHWICSGACKVV